MPAVYYLVTLILQRVNADQLRSAGHQFRVDFHDAQNGITPPPYHAPGNSFTPIGLLVGVVTLAAVVVACIWQHRAASAGRALGIPSRRSPAWGVGSWFVPIVNLWVPYSAVRDCLPPDHPHRPRVLQWWIAWLLAAYLSTAAAVCALVSTGVALVAVRPGRAGLPGGHRLGAGHRDGHRGGPSGGVGAHGRGDGGSSSGLRRRPPAVPKRGRVPPKPVP